MPDSVNLADPTVVDRRGTFWAYGTNHPRPGAKVPVYRADDITGPYTYEGKAMAEIPWAKDETAVFTPDVRHTGGDRVLLYFVATHKDSPNARKCIGAAVSNNVPCGPFVARSTPLKSCTGHLPKRGRCGERPPQG